jgi:hypothetical protein
MTQRTPPRATRFVEPEITPPNPGWRSTPALPDPGRARMPGAKLETFGIIVLAPAIIVLSAVILVALLDIFVAWLCVVGVLFAATVLSDLVYRFWRWARPTGALYHRPVGYPGR